MKEPFVICILCALLIPVHASGEEKGIQASYKKKITHNAPFHRQKAHKPDDPYRSSSDRDSSYRSTDSTRYLDKYNSKNNDRSYDDTGSSYESPYYQSPQPYRSSDTRSDRDYFSD